MLDALIRHRLISKLAAIDPRITLLAQAHTVSTITIIIAIQWAFSPSAVDSRIAVITSTLAIHAASISTAARLANTQTVGGSGIRRAFATNSDTLVVNGFVHANTVTGTVVAARIRERSIRSVNPLVARHASELFIANTSTELL